MAGCDASTPPDSEDGASPSMLQLGGQDQTLANNEMEGNEQDHNDQPDQPQANLPVDEQPGGRQKANAGFNFQAAAASPRTNFQIVWSFEKIEC